jgi:anti-sigma factor RsiW
MSCHRIDDFLDGELEEPDRSLFEGHLATCHACASIVDQQRRLNRLLTVATQHLDRPSPGLVRKIDRRWRAKRRSRYLACAAALCAAAAIAWAVLSMLPRRKEPLPAERKPTVEVAEANIARPPVRISFAHESKLLIVPEETGSPNVTFVWVYPNQHKQR